MHLVTPQICLSAQMKTLVSNLHPCLHHYCLALHSRRLWKCYSWLFQTTSWFNGWNNQITYCSHEAVELMWHVRWERKSVSPVQLTAAHDTRWPWCCYLGEEEMSQDVCDSTLNLIIWEYEGNKKMPQFSDVDNKDPHTLFTANSILCILSRHCLLRTERITASLLLIYQLISSPLLI